MAKLRVEKEVRKAFVEEGQLSNPGRRDNTLTGRNNGGEVRATIGSDQVF